MKQHITTLLPHQVFVFGSNTKGIHGKGAALQATKFGAVFGQPVGHFGQTYAIPTRYYTGNYIKSLSLDVIGNHVNDFLEYAAKHPNLEFLVTPIGTGLAGYTSEQIAPLFDNPTPNVILPQSFIDARKAKD